MTLEATTLDKDQVAEKLKATGLFLYNQAIYGESGISEYFGSDFEFPKLGYYIADVIDPKYQDEAWSWYDMEYISEVRHPNYRSEIWALNDVPFYRTDKISYYDPDTDDFTESTTSYIIHLYDSGPYDTTGLFNHQQ